MTNIQLSPHFTLDEATYSSTALRLGIDNTQPSAEIIKAAIYTASKLEVVRTILQNKSIHIDSFIRCLALNRALGSKDSSQHIKGEAADIICPDFGSPLDICKELITNKAKLNFDQLILEHTWVHVSFCSPTDTPRGEVLSLLSTGGYAVGLTDKQGNKL